MTAGSASRIVIGLLACIVVLQIINTVASLIDATKSPPDLVDSFFRNIDEREARSSDRLKKLQDDADARLKESKDTIERKERVWALEEIDRAGKRLLNNKQLPSYEDGKKMLYPFTDIWNSELIWIRHSDSSFTVVSKGPDRDYPSSDDIQRSFDFPGH